MDEIGVESNRQAWGRLSADHYAHFKRALQEGRHGFNPHIAAELVETGELNGRRIIHLQCNTGADTILLAQLGESAVGVDFVPDNIRFARQLAADLGVSNASFIESDVLRLTDQHPGLEGQYDVAFVSEGSLVWLPSLAGWAQTIRRLLAPGGFLYVFDSHPFYMMLDERRLGEGALEVKYPYFSREPAIGDKIGGYATEPKPGVAAYEWVHSVGEIIGSLAAAGLGVEYFHEFPENFFNARGTRDLGNGLFAYAGNSDRFPVSFSLKATVRER
ncbi:MAG: class I SAM-dependent methyltransferase [Coriobacteriia bacterium]|nr:class I SAM-dependent methyltransferase [Coriobacteriia bacterium]